MFEVVEQRILTVTLLGLSEQCFMTDAGGSEGFAELYVKLIQVCSFKWILKTN